MMKRALLPLLLTFPLFHIGGCSSEDAPVIVPGTAGTGSPGTSGSGSGGSSPTGTSGSGTGVSGSGTDGGSSTGTSGSTSGGSEAGGSGTGGSGTSGSGTTGGSATGGSATGGSGTGGTGTAGSGTGGGSGGSGMGSAVSVGKLDGMLITTPCGDSPSGDDCLGGGIIYEGKTIACQGGQLDSDFEKERFDFPITGGEMGKHYTATVHFYGMMEPKNYGNTVTREAGTQRPNETQNPSKPEPWATAPGGATVARTTYNNYEVHSFDETGKEIAQYYVNSDLKEGHYMFAINYERKIEIVSGGKIHVRVLDTNCRMIKNCLGGPPCSDQKARRIDLTGADPQPVGLMQPGLGKPVEHSGQWWFIDVKDIVAK